MSDNQEQILQEQEDVLQNNKKNMLVSASAGSGKTHIMIKYICKLIVDRKVPVKNLLVLTFTKAAALQMKDRLLKCLKKIQNKSDFIFEQIDALSTANISTIHSFCEKALKKYASLIGLNENFLLIDENMARNFEENAFEIAYKKLEEENEDDFQTLTGAFKNNKTSIRDIVFEIQKLADSVADCDKFFQDILNHFEESFEKSAEFLLKDFQTKVSQKLNELERLHTDSYETQLKSVLNASLKAKDIFQLDSLLKDVKFPRRPPSKVLGEDVAMQIDNIKSVIDKKIKSIKALDLSNEENIQFQRSGTLEKSVLCLYQTYTQQYSKLKHSQNCLDFSDLEKYMKVLSEKEKLFDNFEYVFVDEYQDINKIQEEIIKNIAKNCNFVAVGDIKQGIYGFRLASSEIFLKDMEDFENDKDSSVNLLKSNFRSSQKVLNFVNDIFKICMTKQTANVDYLGTSMLQGQAKFVDDKVCAVNIDIIQPQKAEEDEIPMIYSVKEAKLFKDKKNELVLLDIKRRINEVLLSEISDGGVLRKATFSDIAILSRSRDSLFVQLENYLQECGIPVMSNSRTFLMDEPEMQVLLNYLRLAINIDDEIALLSVLASGLYRCDFQTILQEKQQKGLIEVVTNSKNSVFQNFNQDLKEFRLDCAIAGVKNAFSKLFVKTNYRSYINLKKNKEKINMLVDKFLEEVEKYNFDLPKLVQYFENVQISVTPEVSAFGDCVTLTTIHNSKGLEYPIVFLIGCDNSLTKQQPKAPVEVNENFGLALKIYDVENNVETNSVRMNAIKESQKQKSYVEEMMLFYVALTRAKNRLYLFGQNSDSIFSKFAVEDCDSYFDFVFYALKDVKENFLTDSKFESADLSVNLIEEIEEIKLSQQKNTEKEQTSPQLADKIQKYLDFSYNVSEIENFRLKESVTSLNNKNKEAKFEKFSTQDMSFSDNFVEIGNAYHLALKTLDFSKIDDIETLNKLLQKNESLNLNLIDTQILWKNIQILKQITCGGKIFKEKEFLMKEKIKNLLGGEVEDEILVQGVVDLFVIFENEILLVDYKYSNSDSAEYLTKKYKEQLKLYKLALENFFKKPVKKAYLLSLKQAKLIEIKV